MRKSRLMRQIEARLGRPLDQALPAMVEEMGLSATAEELGVSKSTIDYWLLKLGWTTVRRVVPQARAREVTPGEGNDAP